MDKPQHADVITSTAHKSKGKQYSTVRIASDFEPSEDEAAADPGFNDAEYRLAYVALTRAQFGLDCESLAWVNGLLPTTTTRR